jgi:hypothetical protein
MALGTPYIADTIPNAVGNGQMQQLTTAQLTTQYGAGNIKTPTKNFSITVGGHTIHGYAGVPIVTNPALLAALTAANAPVV